MSDMRYGAEGEGGARKRESIRRPSAAGGKVTADGVGETQRSRAAAQRVSTPAELKELKAINGLFVRN